MSRYALTNGANRVTNVVEWDGISPFTLPAGITARLLANQPVEIDDTFDGTTLTKATKIVPPDELNRQALLAKGPSALAANKAFLAIPSPTNAQSLAQIQSLTKQMNGLIRLVMDKLDSTEDT